MPDLDCIFGLVAIESRDLDLYLLSFPNDSPSVPLGSNCMYYNSSSVNLLELNTGSHTLQSCLPMSCYIFCSAHLLVEHCAPSWEGQPHHLYTKHPFRPLLKPYSPSPASELATQIRKQLICSCQLTLSDWTRLHPLERHETLVLVNLL